MGYGTLLFHLFPPISPTSLRKEGEMCHIFLIWRLGDSEIVQEKGRWVGCATLLFHLFLSNQPVGERDVRHIFLSSANSGLCREGKLLAGLTLLAIEATLPVCSGCLYLCTTIKVRLPLCCTTIEATLPVCCGCLYHHTTIEATLPVLYNNQGNITSVLFVSLYNNLGNITVVSLCNNRGNITCA